MTQIQESSGPDLRFQQRYKLFLDERFPGDHRFFAVRETECTNCVRRSQWDCAIIDGDDVRCWTCGTTLLKIEVT